MRVDILQKLPLLCGLTTAVFLNFVCTLSVQAGDYRTGNPYRFYPYDYYGGDDRFGLQQDINRLNRQMQRQQRNLQSQFQLQQEQTRLLRAQQSADQQFTAMQACYYRYNGGLDLCEVLFDVASEDHSKCVKKAVEINPGCARDIARTARRSKDAQRSE